MRYFLSATLVALTVLAVGCSKSEEGPATAAAPVAPPDATIREFLEAIRTGNDKQAESMLTDLARQKTAQADLMVAPPGSPSASYKIGEMEVIDGQVAHVSTIWTDTGDDGKPQSNEFVWALRLEPSGWRVAGVAVALFPNQPPLLLDFEDPADMMRKQQMAEQEMQRQMNPQQTAPQNVQAGGPMTAQGTQPGQVQPAGATGPAPTNYGAPGMLPGTATAPGAFTPGTEAPLNAAAAPQPGSMVPGSLPPAPLPGAPVVGGQNTPTNLPPVAPYTPAAPTSLPPVNGNPGAAVPLQAEQPQPGTLPRQ